MYGFLAVERYCSHLESLYHTYGLPMGGRCSLLNFGSKGQRSSALDIEVAIWFPGLITLRYQFHIESPYHTFGLSMEQRRSL
jgi:hypothetical protein